MLGQNLLESILFLCIFNSFIFFLSFYVVFVIFKTPIYHIMSLYMLYHFVGFVVRPWELYLSGTSQLWSYIGTTPSPGDVFWGAIVVALAHGAMLVGFLLVNDRAPVAVIRPFSFVPKRPIIFYALASLFLLLGARASQAQFGDVTSLDDLAALSQSIDSSGALRMENMSGYQTMFAEFIPITLVILFSDRRARIAATAVILIFVVFRSFAGTGRSSFVVVLLAMGCALLIEARRRFPPAALVAVGLIVLALFNLLGSDRMTARRLFAGETTITEVLDSYIGSRGDAPITGDMKEFDVLTALLAVVPERSGYTYGTQYLRLLVWPIPRSIWADKPVYTSIVDLVNYGNFAFLTITIYGDSYMTIGLSGMVIVLVLLSMLMNKLYQNAMQLENPISLIMYFVFVMYCPILFRDGPVSAAYFMIIACSAGIALASFGGLRNVRASDFNGQAFLTMAATRGSHV